MSGTGTFLFSICRTFGALLLLTKQTVHVESSRGMAVLQKVLKKRSAFINNEQDMEQEVLVCVSAGYTGSQTRLLSVFPDFSHQHFTSVQGICRFLICVFN